jgi:hypothetical protein
MVITQESNNLIMEHMEMASASVPGPFPVNETANKLNWNEKCIHKD